MKRKILVLLCLAMMLALVFVACDGGNSGDGGESGNGGDGCEHTFSENWSSDATSHWHPATCEHGEIKDALADHADADEDGNCDVCAYAVGHTHTYSEEWTSDETNHWKVATCTHTEEKAELSLHSDSDQNGECDVCKGHVHIVDASGACTVCGEQVIEIDVNDIKTVIDAVVARHNNVTGGKVNYNYKSQSRSSGSVERSSVVEYKLGKGVAYVKTTQAALDFESEAWFELISEESVFGVISYDGGRTFERTAASMDQLNGYIYFVSTLVNANSAEGILSALYENSQAATAKDYVLTQDDENNTFSFSYNYLYINTDTAAGEDDHADYYEVTVSFSYTDDFVLTKLDIKADCYTNSVPGEEDYTYNQESKTITMKPDATADTYTFSTTQTAGERTYQSEHPYASFMPTDFGIYTDEELTTAIGNTITVETEQYTKLYLGKPTPATSTIGMFGDLIDISVRNQDLSSFDIFEPVFDPIKGTLGIFSKVTGRFTVTITCGDISKSFTVVVNKPAEPEFDESQLGPNEFVVWSTDTYSWVDLCVFEAKDGEGTYKLHLPAGLGLNNAADVDSGADKTFADVDFNSPNYDNVNGATHTISLKAGEVYSFYISARTKGYWIISYEFTPGTVTNSDGTLPTPDYKDANGLGGSYTFTALGTYKLNFTPDSEGGTTGTLTVRDPLTNVSTTYGYSIANGEYTFTLNGAVTTEIEVKKNGSDWTFKNASLSEAQKFA